MTSSAATRPSSSRRSADGSRASAGTRSWTRCSSPSQSAVRAPGSEAHSAERYALRRLIPSRYHVPLEGRMALEQQLNDTLKQAIKDKDRKTADVVRMLKTKLMERRTAKGFSGEGDDALVP